MNKITYYLSLVLVPVLFVCHLSRGLRIAIRNAWVGTRSDIASARRVHRMD
jgi:hypothetical protein